MALREWYAQNADRINGIAKANNVDIGVAKGMLESNAKGTTNYKGGGIADMGELSRSYYAAAQDGQNKFNARGTSRTSNKSSGSKYKTSSLDAAYQKQIEDAYKEAARQAYISKMQSQLHMGDYLASQGYSGGVAETTLAGLNSDYGNALATAQSQKADSQLGLLQKQQEQANYQREQDFARQQYEQSLAMANQEYADSRSDTEFNNAYKLYSAGIITPEVLETLGLGGTLNGVASATGTGGGTTYKGGKVDSGGTPAVTTNNGTPTTYTDFRQSLTNPMGNVQNSALQGLTQMFANGEIDLTTYKQRLGRIGFTTDGKSVYPL